MKIGILTTYFYPFKGGAEANAYYSAKELSKKHEVHIFTSDRKNNLIIDKKEEKIGNINVHRSKTLFRYKYYFAFYPNLVTNLLKYKLDIIHVHSLGFIWHDICIIIKKIAFPKTKFILTPHGPFMTLKNYPVWQKILKYLITNTTTKLTNKIYSKIIQVNPYQEKWLEKEYSIPKEKIIYIPNGIDEELLKKSNILKNNTPENKFIISYVGRLHKYKGIQHVIQILPDLIKYKKNLVFMVIGEDAGYYKELSNLTKKLNLIKYVKFFTNIDNKEKYKILESSEIFIMPSEWEAFSIVILEAMAKGNAIISTNTEGGKFLVNKENGIIYNFGDLRKLEESLRKLIHNNKIRKNTQKHNVKKAKTFVWNKIALKLEEVYNNIQK